MNKLYYTIFPLIIIFLLTSCSNSDDSYAEIIIVNNEQYIGQEEVKQSEYKLVKIGEIEKNVGVKEMPTEEFSSNTADIGTEIYSIKNDENAIVIKETDGSYRIFKIKATND